MTCGENLMHAINSTAASSIIFPERNFSSFVKTLPSLNNLRGKDQCFHLFRLLLIFPTVKISSSARSVIISIPRNPDIFFKKEARNKSVLYRLSTLIVNKLQSCIEKTFVTSDWLY